MREIPKMLSYVPDENAHVLSEVHTDCQFRVLPDSDNAVTRFKITFHKVNTNTKSKRTYLNKQAGKSEAKEKIQTEFDLKDSDSVSKVEHEEVEESDQSNTTRNGEIFDEDGDLILERRVCKSKNRIIDETHGEKLYKTYSNKSVHDYKFDRNVCLMGNFDEDAPVKKKIKLEELNDCTSLKPKAPTEDKLHDTSNSGDTENTENKTENSQNTLTDNLVEGSQSSVLACEHCGINYDCRGISNKSDTSENDKFEKSDTLDNDRGSLCGICVKKELAGEYSEKEVKNRTVVVEEGDKNSEDVKHESDDVDSAIYYINIKHSLSTELDDVGEQVWHGSLLLSDYILCNHGNFDNKVIIDLGAGVGLSSIVAAMYAKMVYCTDAGEKILSLADGNILTAQTCPTLPKQLCDIHVKELDWFKGIKEDSCKFGLTTDDVDRIRNSDILIAADVIYDFDITDAFFNVVKQIMSHAPSKTLYIGLEKRIVFTCDDLTVSSPGYNYFRLNLDDLCSGEDNDTEVLFEAEQMDTSFPQLFQYNRIKQLELWKITSTFKS